MGGTNVRAGAYLDSGVPAAPDVSLPSRATEGTEAIVGAISEAVGIAKAATPEACAIGLAVPGHVDAEAGLVRWAPNLGETVDGVFNYWRDVPLRDALESRVGLPTILANDANAAALGEYRFGVGRGSAACLVMLTLGTGIGGGVVMSPRSLVGPVSGPVMLIGGNGGGAELGHTIVQWGGLDANAGAYGALEGYCQRDAIVRRAVHRILRGRASMLKDMALGDLSSLTPLMLSEAARQGDELALEVWTEVGQVLGAAIGSLINVFAPDVFAIGGQIAKAGAPLLDPARRTAANVAIPTLYADCRIVAAEQIEDAGMLGAAAIALEWLKWKKN